MPGTQTIELVMAFGGTMVGMGAVRRGTAAAVLAVTAAAGGAAAADPCPATALLYGEPELIESGSTLLRDRGVAITGQSGCDAVIAVVAHDVDGERVRVTITDAGGRSVERVVDDVAAAATTIESWARRDLTAPLLAMREQPVVAAFGTTTEPDRDAGATPAPASRRRGFALAATAELGGSSDGGIWTAARLQAGIGIGAGFRAGAIVRIADDTDGRGAAFDRNSSRWTLDLLAALDRPFPLGQRITLRPGIAIGQTTLRVGRDSVESPSIEETELMLLGQVGAQVRIAGAWSVGIDIALDVAPFAPALVDDPPEDPDDEPQLAGFPRMRGWFGVGLTYGDP